MPWPTAYLLPGYIEVLRAVGVVTCASTALPQLPGSGKARRAPPVISGAQRVKHGTSWRRSFTAQNIVMPD